MDAVSRVPWGKVVGIAKKIYRWYQKRQRKNQQGQTQPSNSGGHPVQQSQNHNQPQPSHQQSPYPPVQHQQSQQHPPQQHHQPGGAYGQQQTQNGYGANDGPPTNQDMMNAQNQQYVGLRNQAIQAGDMGARCSRDSQSAYQAGDGAKAKELSIEANEHRRMQDVYDGQAAQWIYDQNNLSQPRGTIDLHGLYVAESIDFAERAIATSKAEHASELRIIVGKGNHSQGKVAKLKPAIEDLMRKEHLSAHLDEHNSGVLVIQLQGQGVGQNRSVGGDLADRDDCVVM